MFLHWLLQYPFGTWALTLFSQDTQRELGESCNTRPEHQVKFCALVCGCKGSRGICKEVLSLVKDKQQPAVYSWQHPAPQTCCLSAVSLRGGALKGEAGAELRERWAGPCFGSAPVSPLGSGRGRWWSSELCPLLCCAEPTEVGSDRRRRNQRGCERCLLYHDCQL